MEDTDKPKALDTPLLFNVLSSRMQAKERKGLFDAIFPRNRLICLRPLPSITAAGLEEKVGKAGAGILPKEKSMKQINPAQAVVTQ